MNMFVMCVSINVMLFRLLFPVNFFVFADAELVELEAHIAIRHADDDFKEWKWCNKEWFISRMHSLFLSLSTSHINTA